MKIHLIGTGGAAMGNLAAMLKQSGHTVTGSDGPLYPPMSDRLKEWKIKVLPFDRKNVQKADLIITGNAISRGNIEVEETLNRNLRMTSMSAAIHDFFLTGRKVIVVAGTHGKTTTTFLIDHILSEAMPGKKRPGLFAGGIRADGHPGFRIPDQSEYFVIEGDEYDTAFFDKAAKFLHYRPYYLILTSVEFDHADIYENLKAYERSFRHLIRWVPSEGMIAACSDSAGVRRVLADYKLSPVAWYGKRPMSDRKVTSFTRSGRDVILGSLKAQPGLIGAHNTLNALAAVLVCRQAGLTDRQIRQGLESFPGVLRRQQVRFERGNILFMEDFAHHPTAVKETIAAVKEAYPKRTVYALFEPRSASSHRDQFRSGYEKAFQKADHVLISEVYNKKKVAESERLDVASLIKTIASRQKKKDATAVYASGPEALLKQFKKNFRRSAQGDVILAMSNGGFGGIYPEIETFLDKQIEN